MTERFQCTKDTPWAPGKPTPVVHVDAHEVDGSERDGWPGGDTVKMICPNCGHTWRKELPQ